MKPLCVITGGTGGIGWHLCQGFFSNNYRVVALDIEKHEALPKGVEFIQTDLSNEASVRSAFQEITKQYGAIHVLINNAAIAHFNKCINQLTMDEFDAVMDVNVRGALICCQEMVKANEGERYGRIINIASTRWNQNEAGWEAYGASKGALISLTNTLAVSLSNTPITVNAISPGWIQTHDYDKLTEADHKQHPSGRVGIPRDIVNAALFLANKENDFVNAVNLVVDGGMTKRMFYVE